MNFVETDIAGVWLVDPVRRGDERGWFARAFCAEAFAELGIDATVAQINTAQTVHAGTVRGLHAQRPPNGEVKVFRVVRGATFNVVVDLRAESATFGQWRGFALDAAGGRALVVPARFLHGYQSQADDTMVLYSASAAYAPGSEVGLSPMDPGLGVEWPLPVAELSEKDAAWAPWGVQRGALRMAAG